MDVRVITLRYQEGLQGFPEEALRRAISGREVLEAREHFFMHGNVPHLALTLLLGDAPADGDGFRRRAGPDPEEGLEEARRPLYRDLKRWRNDRARAEGKPAYAIARNAQLAEIARLVPRSLAVGSSKEDWWACPSGEFTVRIAASVEHTAWAKNTETHGRTGHIERACQADDGRRGGGARRRRFFRAVMRARHLRKPGTKPCRETARCVAWYSRTGRV